MLLTLAERYGVTHALRGASDEAHAWELFSCGLTGITAQQIIDHVLDK